MRLARFMAGLHFILIVLIYVAFSNYDQARFAPVLIYKLDYPASIACFWFADKLHGIFPADTGWSAWGSVLLLGSAWYGAIGWSLQTIVRHWPRGNNERPRG
jgi:hypothetical protein